MRARFIVATAIPLAASLVVLASSRDGESATDAGADAHSDAAVNGRLPPAEIQRIVRANFARFKICYSVALDDNPHLRGCVVTRFVIDLTGHVSAHTDVTPAALALPDDSVRACVVNAFGDLEFPPPVGGVVTVVYPLVFQEHPDAGVTCPLSPRDGGAHD